MRVFNNLTLWAQTWITWPHIPWAQTETAQVTSTHHPALPGATERAGKPHLNWSHVFPKAGPCTLTFLLVLGKFKSVILRVKKALTHIFSYITGLWATCSSARCLCPGQGRALEDLWSSLPAQASLWFPQHPAFKSAVQNQTWEEFIEFADDTDLVFLLTFSLLSSDCLSSSLLITFRTRFLINVPKKKIIN